MSNLISINIEKTTKISQALSHNVRLYKPDYLIEGINKNINISYDDDLRKFKTRAGFEEFQKIRTKLINEDYQKNNKQKMQSKTILFKEAVISFGRSQFEKNNLKDINKQLTKYVEEFENRYKVKVLCHSLHLDEGNTNEHGEAEHNYHAHLIIQNYDFKTHKTGMRNINYSNLQTELAKSFEALGFARGKDYKKLNNEELAKANLENREPELIKKPTHLSHNKYRKQQEELKQKKQLEILEAETRLKALKKEAENMELANSKARLELRNRKSEVLQVNKELRSLASVKSDLINEVTPKWHINRPALIKALEKTLQLKFENFETEIAKNYNFFYKSKIGTYENSLQDLKTRENKNDKELKQENSFQRK